MAAWHNLLSELITGPNGVGGHDKIFLFEKVNSDYTWLPATTVPGTHLLTSDYWVTERVD